MREADHGDRAPVAGSRSTANGVLAPGALGGVLAALVMAAYMMLSAAVHGMEPLAPLEPIGATFIGPKALEGGAVSLLYGAVLHLAVSAALGVGFAVLLPAGFSPGHAAAVGIGYAFVVMAMETSVILPEVNPVLREAMPELGGSWVIAYSLFGAALGSVPWLRGRLRLAAARPSAEKDVGRGDEGPLRTS